MGFLQSYCAQCRAGVIADTSPPSSSSSSSQNRAAAFSRTLGENLMFLSGVPYSHFSAHDFIAPLFSLCELSKCRDWGPPSRLLQEVRSPILSLAKIQQMDLTALKRFVHVRLCSVANASREYELRKLGRLIIIQNYFASVLNARIRNEHIRPCISG